MKWPQFELWRLMAAITVFAVAMGCFVAGYHRMPFIPALWPTGTVALGASMGIPFKRGFAFAVGLPIVLILLITIVFVLLVLIARLQL